VGVSAFKNKEGQPGFILATQEEKVPQPHEFDSFQKTGPVKALRQANFSVKMGIIEQMFNGAGSRPCL
jgi:hypothetical protein